VKEMISPPTISIETSRDEEKENSYNIKAKQQDHRHAHANLERQTKGKASHGKSKKFLYFKFSSKLRRSIEVSLRTAWAVFMTMLFQHFWNWSDVIAYVSPVISVIASVSCFGLWQQNAFKVGYGTVIGGGVGVAIAYTTPWPYILVILLFFSMVWINSLAGWDRLTKVMATLALILGTVFPLITKNTVYGLHAYRDILALINVPFIITGVTLLFPKPALAIYEIQSNIVFTTRKLSLMTKSIIKAFLSYDYIDLHIAEFNQLLSELSTDMTQLKQLHGYLINEEYIFQENAGLSHLVEILINIFDLILIELDLQRLLQVL
jgi:hypothetical protein